MYGNLVVPKYIEVFYMDLISSATTGITNAANAVVNTAESLVGGVVNGVMNGITGLTSGNVQNLAQLLRSGSLPPGAETALFGQFQKAAFASESGYDWRVKLSLPYIASYQSSPVMAPLLETSGVVFPYTPQVGIKHKANYNSLDTVHNNFPFAAYNNSAIEEITISGDFYVEDTRDAVYWVAMNYYFSAVTKMSYGQTTNTGAPPPVVYLSGYGQHVLNEIPVVITDYSINLPNDVDYIACTPLSNEGTSGVPTYVPVKSQVSVSCRVLYSREQVRKFSLDAFVQGNYVLSDNGGVGFL